MCHLKFVFFFCLGGVEGLGSQAEQLKNRGFHMVVQLKRRLWLATPLCLFWAIWKERNHIVFEDVTFFLPRLKTAFICSLMFWAGLLDVGEGSSVNGLMFIL